MKNAKTLKNKEFQERREYLAKALNTAKNDYYHSYMGDSLTIVGPIIEALSTATAAQVIRQGSSSLLLSLKLALQGIELEKCSAGVIGKVLNTISNKVADCVVNSYLDKEDIGSKELFRLMCQVLILAVISIAWKLEQYHLTDESKLPDDYERDRLKTFEFELILLLILKTGLMQTVIESLTAACGANSFGQGIVTQFMTPLILFLALLTGAKKDQSILKMLVLDLKDYLIEGLENIQIFINKIEEAGEKTSNITIFVQQAIASLQDEDFDTLREAYASALDIIDANAKLLDEDIEQVTKFAAIIFNAITQGSFELSQKTTASLMI